MAVREGPMAPVSQESELQVERDKDCDSACWVTWVRFVVFSSAPNGFKRCDLAAHHQQGQGAALGRIAGASAATALSISTYLITAAARRPAMYHHPGVINLSKS